VKTLVIQTAFLGDLLLTLPLVKALKLQDEDGEVQLLIRAGYSEVLQNNPDLSDVLELDKGIGKGMTTSSAVAEIKRRKFDRAIIPHRSLRSALIAYLANIPERIGFFSAPGYILYTESVEYPPTGHQILRMLVLAKEKGTDIERFPITVFPDDNNFDKADDVISGIIVGRAENIAAIAPGSVWPTKRWPVEYFAELGNYLIRERDFHLILTGSKDDRDICFEIGEQLPSSGWAITAGEFSIMDTAAVFARSSFVVANDSAAGHLASAVNTPVLTIYGPTVPSFGFYPIGKDNIIAEYRHLYCRPCSKHGPRKCPEEHFKCMLELIPDYVISLMDPLLEGT